MSNMVKMAGVCVDADTTADDWHTIVADTTILSATSDDDEDSSAEDHHHHTKAEHMAMTEAEAAA